jgi:hypothetical protein
MSAKLQLGLTSEKDQSQAMLDIDLKRSDWNGQLKIGSNEFWGAQQSTWLALVALGACFGCLSMPAVTSVLFLYNMCHWDHWGS